VTARQDRADPFGQWRAAKTAASHAVARHGATATHHHAVGTEHASWLGEEVGEVGLRLLRAVKGAVDPVGILNPGNSCCRRRRDRVAAALTRRTHRLRCPESYDRPDGGSPWLGEAWH
jgi:hypothetical protein